jgi:hypothetical protein
VRQGGGGAGGGSRGGQEPSVDTPRAGREGEAGEQWRPADSE